MGEYRFGKNNYSIKINGKVYNIDNFYLISYESEEVIKRKIYFETQCMNKGIINELNEMRNCEVEFLDNNKKYNGRYYFKKYDDVFSRKFNKNSKGKNLRYSFVQTNDDHDIKYSDYYYHQERGITYPQILFDKLIE